MVNHIYNKDKEKVTVLLTKPVGRVFSFTRENCPGHINFDELLVSLSKKMSDIDFIPYLNEIESFIQHGKGIIEYNEKTEDFTLSGVVLSESLKARYSTMIAAEQDVTPLENFIKNLQKNKYKDIREELFSFMDANELPITEDGCFLAYKTVNSSYRDKHSDSIDNSIGQKPFMKPEEVNRDRMRTCSTGFHFTSREYATRMFYSYGDKVMIVKVDPANVMAIPVDYNAQKGRCNTYEVVSELDHTVEDIKKNFVSKEEEFSGDIKIDIEETNPMIKKEKPSDKSSIDFLVYEQATFEKQEWTSNGVSYTGYKLMEIPAGKDYKVLLENEKRINPELKLFFNLHTVNGIKPNRQITPKDRTLVAVIGQGKKGELSKVLKAAKILLPLKTTVIR